MKIEKIRIQHLRAFEDEEVTFDDYVALVGANGAGKSTILCALNIFFREAENATTDMNELDIEDFHLRDTSKPIVITVTFKDLTPEQEDLFSAYARQGTLTISAKAAFDEASGKALVEQYGERLGMDSFRRYFGRAGGGARVDELRGIYAELRAAHELPEARTLDAMKTALNEFEAAHPEQCVLIPSSDQFYGFSKGANRLAQCVQWVYVPAVKDATKEQLEGRATALGRLLGRTVRNAVKFDEEIARLHTETMEQYSRLLEERQEPLVELSTKLQTRLSEWAHPDVKVSLTWRQDPKKAVQIEEPFARMVAGEGDFEGELARFGHGLQRSYLLALLQELAAADDENAPTLLLGIEEPELYQHPPQARHLSSVLQTLSEGNTQVVVSTHSPHFVTGKGFEAVRMVRKIPEDRRSVVRRATSQEVGDAVAAARGEAAPVPDLALAKLNQILQPSLSEMFFTPRLVLLEGLEDVALITSWLVLTNKWEEFRRRGCHLVAVNGKSELVQPLVIAQKFGVPTFVVFDADGSYAAKPAQAPKHINDNLALLNLLGADTSTPFPPAALWGEDYVIWPENIATALKADLGDARWEEVNQQAQAQFGFPSNFGKNAMHIGTKLALIHGAGESLPTLDQLCDRILAFAA